MLILSRKIGEMVVIGRDGLITVTLLGIKGNNARIGINAPKSVSIHRNEIYQRIQADKTKNSEES